jgi:hypothetical protein
MENGDLLFFDWVLNNGKLCDKNLIYFLLEDIFFFLTNKNFLLRFSSTFLMTWINEGSLKFLYFYFTLFGYVI